MRKTSNTNSTSNLDSEDVQKCRCQCIRKFRKIFWGWDFWIWVAGVILWDLYSLKYFFLKFVIYCVMLTFPLWVAQNLNQFSTTLCMYWFAVACHGREGEQEQFRHRVRFQLYTSQKLGFSGPFSPSEKLISAVHEDRVKLVWKIHQKSQFVPGKSWTLVQTRRDLWFQDEIR